MANFTVINNYTFPSPSIRQNSGQTMVFTPTSFNTTNVLGTICSTTIQFPSPTYVIATQSNGCLPVSDQRSGLYTNSSNVCTRLKGDWQHDVPSTMPWMNQYFSNTVTFTGDTISTGSSGSTSTVNGRCLKRKGEMRNVPVDSKVFINEDRVAEGMRNLQLSAVGNNNSSVAADRNQAWFTATPQSQSTTGEYPQTEVEMCDEDVVEGGVCEEEGAETSGPRLHLCEQLRARLANRDILQSLITTELTKSNKQLVLWTPPGGHITLMLRSESGSLCGQSERSQALDLIDMGSTVVSSNSGVSSTQKSAMSVAVEDSTTSFSTPARSHPGTLQDSTLTVPTRSSPFAAQNISTPASPQNHSSQSVLQGSDLLSPWLQMHNNNNGISVRHNGGGVLAHSSARSLLVEEEGISVNPELAYLGVDHMEDEDLNL